VKEYFIAAANFDFQGPSNENNNLAIIVGSVMGGAILIIACVSVLAFVLYRRFNELNQFRDSNISNNHKHSDSNTEAVLN
ncbi:16708_t:CDS:2, partial [Entrophospora sp. SA101]